VGGKLVQIPTPNGGTQFLSEEQLVIAGIGSELAAAADGCTRIAGMRAEIGGAQWRGVVAGTAEELGFLADRIHDTRRALQAFAEEYGDGSTTASTRRDIATRKERNMNRFQRIFMGLAGFCGAAAGALKLLGVYPNVTIVLVVLAAGFAGVVVKVPETKPKENP